MYNESFTVIESLHSIYKWYKWCGLAMVCSKHFLGFFRFAMVTLPQIWDAA